MDAVIDRLQQITASGVTTQVDHILIGQDGVTLSLRNTARSDDGRKLDEHLTTVLRLRDGQIFEIET